MCSHANRRRRPLGILLLTAVCGCANHEETFRIGLNTADRTATSFDVDGLNAVQLAAIDKLDAARQAALFRVFVSGEQVDPSPLLGSVSIEGQRLRFTPRYPLEPGLSYRAVFAIEDLPGAKRASVAGVSATFEIPKRPADAATVVEHIYPSAERLPENQLKFYLHFSAPMSRGEAYRHIHLADSSGKEIEAAFLELGEELWDPSMRRFTLLCDPGRVKRGLKPREELGPVLEEGKSYTLVIDRDWPDARGEKLQAPGRKAFQVLPPDDTPIDPSLWKIEPPPGGSSEAVSVRFPEPLDHSLLERVVSIANPAGQKVVGAIEISEDETCWRFRPQQPWTPGEYQLVADTRLEDLAGNAIGRAFDVDVFAPIRKTIETETVSVPFTVARD